MNLTATRGVTAPYRVPVYIVCTVFALIVNYLLGKDMAWDTLSYHICTGFNAVVQPASGRPNKYSSTGGVAQWTGRATDSRKSWNGPMAD